MQLVPLLSVTLRRLPSRHMLPAWKNAIVLLILGVKGLSCDATPFTFASTGSTMSRPGSCAAGP